MLGSIVQQLLPYYSSSSSAFGSVANSIYSISSIALGSFGTMFKPLISNATDDSAQYQLCDDPSIQNNDIAAGPFCNIIYGIPTQYLNEDPVTVSEDLSNSGDIDSDSGEPVSKSDYAKWLDMCTDGTADQANNCTITDQTTAEYALYTNYYRIQQSMDGTSDGDLQ
jgi:hypothetical protein